MYLKKSTELSEGKDITKKLKNSMEKNITQQATYE